MNPLIAHIKESFDESIKTKTAAKEMLSESILKASQQLVACLKANKKILICGNGGSAAESQHLASELMNRFLIERPSLPAIALTTDTSTITSIANDYSYNQIFSKQVQALGQAGDTLVLISTSGCSINILQAYETAKDKKLNAIALTGNNGGRLAVLLKSHTADIEICIPSSTTARIQEMHLFVIHCLCDLIDKQLYAN